MNAIKLSTRQLPSVSVWQYLALGCFLDHTWIAVSVCLCFLWGVVVVVVVVRESQSLHYKENTLLCCWAWDSVRDFLLETVILDDPKWNMKALCVCMCAGSKTKECTHPCIIFWWIRFLPPLIMRWLSRWWRVASFCFSGGRWDVTVVGAAASMCLTALPPTGPPHPPPWLPLLLAPSQFRIFLPVLSSTIHSTAT